MPQAYSRLLIDEYPLIVLPALAHAIGLNEAIILQQVHYWLSKSPHRHDDKPWIYNSYEAWHGQFPFWSRNTIIRAIRHLEELGLLLVGNYNRLKLDHTKWYTIDYTILGKWATQNGQTINSSWVKDQLTFGSAIPETIPETTTEKEGGLRASAGEENQDEKPPEPQASSKCRNSRRGKHSWREFHDSWLCDLCGHRVDKVRPDVEEDTSL